MRRARCSARASTRAACSPDDGRPSRCRSSPTSPTSDFSSITASTSGAWSVVDGDSLIRIDFTPAPVVHDPDVAGTIFLDPTSYQLRITDLSLVNLTRQLRGQMSGQSIRAHFQEVIPGVPVLNAVSSVVYPKDDRRRAAAGTGDGAPAHSLRSVPARETIALSSRAPCHPSGSAARRHSTPDRCPPRSPGRRTAPSPRAAGCTGAAADRRRHRRTPPTRSAT